MQKAQLKMQKVRERKNYNQRKKNRQGGEKNTSS